MVNPDMSDLEARRWAPEVHPGFFGQVNGALVPSNRESHHRPTQGQTRQQEA